ncbi:MAG: tetratricopeptide repeat protein [Anaerolineales bacterium]|nr:tetratricopeptide repeat protein [Anaerolineales bacterium]
MEAVTAESLKDEGLHQFQRGEYETALETFDTAVSAFAAADNLTGQVEMYNNIGVIHRLRGHYDEALQALDKAQALCDTAGDDNRRAQVLGNMGDLYKDRGDRDQAARCYSDAAALFAQTGDRDKQSQVLRALSLMRMRQGSWYEAMLRMQESLTIKPQRGLFGGLFLVMLRFALRLFGAVD